MVTIQSEADTLLAVAGWLIKDEWALRQVSPFPWAARERVAGVLPVP